MDTNSPRVTSGVARPNRLLDKKDKEYHKNFARYIISKANLWQQTYFIKKYLVNMSFYKGNQWIFDEDMDSFLMDESGDVRNRIQFVHNIVKPYVEYFRGSMVKMDLSFSVDSISRDSINKREELLGQLLFMQKVAKDFKGTVADKISSKFPVRATKEQTIETFNNLFVDEDTQKIKYLIEYIADRNDFEDIKVNLAEDLCFGGIVIVKEHDANGHQYFKLTYPPNFFWDLTARKKDLSDADWMGDFSLKSAVEILERYQDLDWETKIAVENIKSTTVPGIHNITDFLYGYTGDKVPVYDLYWRDIENDVHGLVMDKFGYVNIVDMKKDGYTDADLIPESKLKDLSANYKFIETLFKFKNKKKITVEYCRYCTVIPGMYANLPDDIILEYGTRPYTHKYHFENPKIEWPYHIGTYAYMDGEVMSPLDSLISPQRYINRVMSMAESAVNNSRGTGTAIDLDSLDDDTTQEEVLSSMNRSKPIYLRANGNVQNAIASYDNTVKAGALTLFSVAKDIKSISDEIVGGGEALKGGGGAYRVTGSVADQNLNQAITLQEPYFYAGYKAIFSCYGAMAGRGKRIYCENERELSIMVGDEGYKIMRLTKDLSMMDFRLKLDRAPSRLEQQQTANQMLLQYLQMGIIDDKTYAANLDNCDVSDLPYVLRKSISIKYEAQAQIAAKQARDAKLNNVIQSAALAEQNQEQQKNEQLGVADNNANRRSQIIQTGMRGEQQQQPVQQPAS